MIEILLYTWENIKKSYKNSKFKRSAPTWNEEFKIPDGSYSVSNIQDYFGYILTNYETVTNNPSIRIYINKIENRITFKMKTRCYLEIRTPETMKLLGSTKSKITKDENGGNVSSLEITEILLIHWNIVNNNRQQDSIVV